MKRLCSALVSCALALGGLVVSSPAQAYPSVTVHISDITQVGGRKIVIKASTDPAVNCTWTLTYNAKTGPKTVTGSGPSINHTFTTRRVPKIVRESATASCTFDDSTLTGTSGAPGGVPASMVAAMQTVSATGDVTLLPLNGNNDGSNDDNDDGDDDDNGSLPDTGGERLLWLILGALLLIGGGVTVLSTRKERSAQA